MSDVPCELTTGVFFVAVTFNFLYAPSNIFMNIYEKVASKYYRLCMKVLFMEVYNRIIENKILGDTFLKETRTNKFLNENI